MMLNSILKEDSIPEVGALEEKDSQWRAREELYISIEVS